MTINKSICVAAVLLAACCWANTASASGPYYDGYWGYSSLGYRCSTVRDFSVPYYSFYPPVYYGASVARPYGHSPFAYPPGITTPSGHVSGEAVVAAAAPEPKRIKNRFVSGSASVGPAADSFSAPVALPPGELEIPQPPSFR